MEKFVIAKLTVNPILRDRNKATNTKWIKARVLLYRVPTDDEVRQWGQFAAVLLRVLNMKISWHSQHWTRQVPAGARIAVPTGPLGPRVITRRQFSRGHAILLDEALQISKQWQGQRTYFLPGGAARIGVASLQRPHLTTWFVVLPSRGISLSQTRQVTEGPRN